MRDAESSQIRGEQGKQPALGDIECHGVIWRIGRQPVGKGRPGRGFVEQCSTEHVTEDGGIRRADRW